MSRILIVEESFFTSESCGQREFIESLSDQSDSGRGQNVRVI